MRFRDLPTPVASAKKTLRILQDKYPTLDAYLVVSSRLGQMLPGTNGIEALRNYPALFVDSSEKKICLRLLTQITQHSGQLRRAHRREADQLKREILSWTKLIEQKIAGLAIDQSAQIELRFGELCYSLLRALQQDELVDRGRTPQGLASIRIVLGPLGELNGITFRDESAGSLERSAFWLENDGLISLPKHESERDRGHSDRDEGFIL